MPFQALDVVVLASDLPLDDLREGDLGAVAHVYEPDGQEVEFVKASGRTVALVTVLVTDVRAVRDSDLLCVRRIENSAQ